VRPLTKYLFDYGSGNYLELKNVSWLLIGIQYTGAV